MGDESLRSKYDSLAFLKEKYKTIDITTIDASNFSEMSELKIKIEGLEKEINRTLPPEIDNIFNLNWIDIQKRISEKEVAMELLFAGHSAAALLLAHDKSPVFIPLCNADTLYEKVSQISNLPLDARVKKLYVDDEAHLYDNLWKPLEGHLKDVRRVYLSPTSFLNTIAFNAIKCEDGSYLMDHYDICQMTSTANITDKDESDSPVKSAMLVGGVCYSPSHKQRADQWRSQKKNIDDADNERGAVVDRENFGFLPYTIDETNNLKSLMEKNKIETSLIEGDDASEQTVVKLSGKSPDVLHLSTHGFFIDDNKVFDNKFLSRFPASRFSSMQRSGIAFVGANATWGGDASKEENSDGIMTANEVAKLDLSNTRLAVLSACQTAVGAYTNEGVLGMYRGFKQAGVKSILATLWSVNDKSTSEFMQEFYSNWLNKQNMHDAFNNAMKTIRNRYPSPLHWAPFILLDAR